jgi:hypothetical protein
MVRIRGNDNGARLATLGVFALAAGVVLAVQVDDVDAIGAVVGSTAIAVLVAAAIPSSWLS